MNQRATTIQQLKATIFGAMLVFAASSSAKAQPAPGRYKATAPKVGTLNVNGGRLEGFPGNPATFQSFSPLIDIRAQVLGVDLRDKAPTQVRALGGVDFKGDLTPSGGTRTHVEATCNNATFDLASSTLVLSGGIKGFYQIGDGPRNTLKGNSARFRYVDNNLSAEVEGGTLVEVSGADFGRPDVGTIAITSTRYNLDQASGTARFIGNARAVSRGGTNAFNVAATEFVLARSSSGTVNTFKTSGRTQIKIDLPPDPPSTTAPSATPATGNSANSIGRPTHVEASGDGATLTGQDQTLILDGNVKGSYQLAPAGAAPQTYNFSGARAVLRYRNQAQGDAPAGFSAEVAGVPNKPAAFDLPASNLNF